MEDEKMEDKGINYFSSNYKRNGKQWKRYCNKF